MYHYLMGLIILLFYMPINAMDSSGFFDERELVDQRAQENQGYFEGQMYIDGPIAYGPEKYYSYLSKQCGIQAHLYEPLIQVSVLINDKDKQGNKTQTLWTHKRTPYESLQQYLSATRSGPEKYPKLPRIIRNFEEKRYKRRHNTDVIPERDAYEMREKYFPSYLPLNLVIAAAQRINKNITSEFHLSLGVYKHIVYLQCINNPELQSDGINVCFLTVAKPFKDLLASKIQDFIKAPRYFKWQHESWGKTAYYSPIRELMNNGFIQEQQLPEHLTRMCHENGVLCSRYCSGDKNTYEHGEKGKEVLEQLKLLLEQLKPKKETCGYVTHFKYDR